MGNPSDIRSSIETFDNNKLRMLVGYINARCNKNRGGFTIGDYSISRETGGQEGLLITIERQTLSKGTFTIIIGGPNLDVSISGDRFWRGSVTDDNQLAFADAELLKLFELLKPKNPLGSLIGRFRGKTSKAL